MAWSEADHKSAAVASFKGRGWYATRVEDKYRVGLLDTIFVMPRATVLAEFKIPKRNFMEPRARQGIEMGQIQGAGGIALLIGCTESVYSFSTSTKRISLNDPGVRHYALNWGPFWQMMEDYIGDAYERQQTGS